MSRHSVISVRGLSKRFRLGKKVTARDPNYFWALKDVNFEVHRGEKVGILGRNGAGKSTLLKILSRLVYPTEGEVRIRGRVTSLLEVGTGFNPELTGRENIYLNASLYGLTPTDIRNKFDEIVAFSGVENFLDMPLKHYSTGMSMRLAFAVAANLDPDILLLDEVLAVGDLAFQQKCLKKIEGLASGGITILLVSHSLDAISRFCTRAIWLEQGSLHRDADCKSVIESYAEEVLNISGTLKISGENSSQKKDSVSRGARLLSAQIISADRTPVSVVKMNEPFAIEMAYEIFETEKMLVPGVAVAGADGQVIFWSVETDPGNLKNIKTPGRHSSIIWLPANFFNEGAYFVHLTMVSPDTAPMERHFYVERGLSFYSTEVESDEEAARGLIPRKFPGFIRPKLVWDYSAGSPSHD